MEVSFARDSLLSSLSPGLPSVDAFAAKASMKKVSERGHRWSFTAQFDKSGVKRRGVWTLIGVVGR